MKRLLFIFFIFFQARAMGQSLVIEGTLLEEGQPVSAVIIRLMPGGLTTHSDASGFFSFQGLSAGKYILSFYAMGYDSLTRSVLLRTQNIRLQVMIQHGAKVLDSVQVRAGQKVSTGFTHLRDVEGVTINAGKKTEVILLKDLVVNQGTNNARQIYAKVAGLNIWENDGAGIQLAIGGRGLSPNRVSNFNTRQNGYDISADALGYPESYYTPPAEAVERIEILRGAASLQYGTQFGGMINFRMNHGADTSKFSGTARLTAGSWNFLNQSASAGGKAGKTNYYFFIQHKTGDGWRPNAGFRSNTVYVQLNHHLNDRATLSVEYTHMDYLEQQPGGLTDADFQADPRQSVRARNWFKVNWNLGAVLFDYRLFQRLTFNTRFFGLLASRDALGLLSFINRGDDGSDRNLYIDQYRNWGNETRLLYPYRLGKINATALVGMRYYQGHTDRQQGYGNNNSGGTKDDFRFTPSKASDSLRYSDYLFPNHNTAVFAENIFRISEKVSIIPGLRYEKITTRAEGSYTNVVFDLAGNPIDAKINRRQFLLGGIGATLAVHPAVQLYANLSQNYKAINFNDLRTQNPNLRVDSALQDEKGYSADLGLRKSNGIVTFDLSVFLIHYNNKIGSILSADTGNFIIYNLRTNVGSSRHYGLESYMEVDVWQWLHGESKTSLAIYSNISVIHARYTKGKDPSIEGNRVEFVPELICKTGITLRRKKWSAGYQLAYTGKQYSDATNASFTANAIDGVVPGYRVMDFTAAYHYNRHLSLSGSVNNLANAHYFTRRADSYPGPGIIPSDGRGYFVTLEWRF